MATAPSSRRERSSRPQRKESSIRPLEEDIAERPSGEDDVRRLVDLIMALRSDRTRGGIAFNRMAGSLAELQKACIADLSQMDVECQTVRYQIDSSATFGTLFAALCTDVHHITQDGDTVATIGSFEPGATSEQLRNLVHIWRAILPTLLNQDPGAFELLEVDSILGAFGMTESMATTTLIFVEVYGSDGDERAVAAWREAEKIIFERLPPGLMLIVSGVPEGYAIPRAPHYCIEIAVIDSAATPNTTSQTAACYITPSLHSDRPTSLDLLDVKPYADALARFVLHEETRPPLTIGIHGPWGKGKSSFMEMIETALFQLSKNVQWGAVGARLAKMTGVPDDPPAQSSRQGAPPGGFPLSSSPTAMMGSWDEFIDEAVPDYRTTRSFPNRLWWRLWLRRPLRGVREEIRERFISIHFNAWQFQDATQTWAGLAHVISEKLEGSLSWPQRLMMRVAYAWKYRRPEMVLDLIPVAAITVSTIVLLLIPDVRDGIAKGLDQGDALGGVLKYALPAGSVLALLWALAWRVTKVAQPVSERVASYIKRPDHRTQMGYQHKVMEDLQFVHRRVRLYRPKCRVIVYVDDLDRCSDEKIMEILRAVNLILANCRFFVFLGMDTEMIYRAVETHYSGKGGTPPEGFAEHYLRKIVQLSFHLPAAPPEKLFDLTSSLFSQRSQDALRERAARRGANGAISTDPQNKAPNGDRMPTEGALKFDMTTIHRPVAIEENVMDTADELEAFHDFQEFLSDNPREIKRLVNVHRLVKILMQRSDGVWQVERQRQLVKWVIFCSLWPDLVDDVLGVAKQIGALNELAKGALAELDDMDTIRLISTEDGEIQGIISQPACSPDVRSQLRSFATIGPPLTPGVCRELELAAQLSQMLHIPPAPKAA